MRVSFRQKSRLQTSIRHSTPSVAALGALLASCAALGQLLAAPAPASAQAAPASAQAAPASAQAAPAAPAAAEVAPSAPAAAQAARSAPAYRFAPGSPDGIGKFYRGREIAEVMGFEGAEWLERPERAREERPDLLVADLKLTPAMTVADIGAGSGYLTRRIAPLVPRGTVYAVDVQPEMVALLGKLAAEPGMGNVVARLGAPDDVKLPPNSLDVAFMVDVYHELAFPAEVITSLVRALKVGGRLVIVEYRGEDPAVPIKALHKMTAAQVRQEMQGFPLRWERTSERLPLQHLIVFERVAGR
jgi:SAM-dependent methyltransferase